MARPAPVPTRDCRGPARPDWCIPLRGCTPHRPREWTAADTIRRSRRKRLPQREVCKRISASPCTGLKILLLVRNARSNPHWPSFQPSISFLLNKRGCSLPFCGWRIRRRRFSFAGGTAGLPRGRNTWVLLCGRTVGSAMRTKPQVLLCGRTAGCWCAAETAGFCRADEKNAKDPTVVPGGSVQFRMHCMRQWVYCMHPWGEKSIRVRRDVTIGAT